MADQPFTLDALIARLQEVQRVHGGDKPVIVRVTRQQVTAPTTVLQVWAVPRSTLQVGNADAIELMVSSRNADDLVLLEPSQPHTIGTEAPTPENDPAGRFRKE